MVDTNAAGQMKDGRSRSRSRRKRKSSRSRSRGAKREVSGNGSGSQGSDSRSRGEREGAKGKGDTNGTTAANGSASSTSSSSDKDKENVDGAAWGQEGLGQDWSADSTKAWLESLGVGATTSADSAASGDVDATVNQIFEQWGSTNGETPAAGGVA